MVDYKVGDKVQRFQGGENNGMYNGEYGTVIRFSPSMANVFVRADKDGREAEHSSSNFKFISNGNKNIMTNIKEKWVLLKKGEPEKSFFKAGITDQNDNLTTDGQAIFLSYLLKENGTKFKTEVVDPILKDQEDSCK